MTIFAPYMIKDNAYLLYQKHFLKEKTFFIAFLKQGCLSLVLSRTSRSSRQAKLPFLSFFSNFFITIPFM